MSSVYLNIIAPQHALYTRHSSVWNPASFNLPHEATTQDLDQIESEFVHSALLAARVGFDAIELHIGHGYLLSQFICPHTNRRTDMYGGSLENRARFPLRVLTAVRAALDKVYGAGAGRFPIIVKFNLSDGFKGGTNISEAVQCAEWYAKVGYQSALHELRAS